MWISLLGWGGFLDTTGSYSSSHTPEKQFGSLPMIANSGGCH